MAREALSQVTVNGGTMTNGNAMQVDAPELSDALIAKITTAREEYVIPVLAYSSPRSILTQAVD